MQNLFLDSLVYSKNRERKRCNWGLELDGGGWADSERQDYGAHLF
jgi:hypothetical protein